MAENGTQVSGSGAFGAGNIDGRAPEIVRSLIDIIGVDAYDRLEARLGGAQIYVPRAPGPDHPISCAVGPEIAALIGDHFCGEKLLLPTGRWRREASTRARILALADTLGGDQIAARLNITRSWVYEVLAEARRTDSRQGNLL